jgi:hypothetical protein
MSEALIEPVGLHVIRCLLRPPSGLLARGPVASTRSEMTALRKPTF